MNTNYLEELKEGLEGKLKIFINKLDKVHIDRINLELIEEEIKVDCQGQKKSLKTVANIRITPARELVIYNFEKRLLASIKDTIVNNELGYGFRLSRENENSTEIYFILTPLTKEKRDKFISQAKLIGEEGKVALRKVREVFRNTVKKDTKLSQDQKRNYQDEIDKLLKDYESKLVSAESKKIKELSS